MNKYLVSETTKEERKEIIKSALGISLLGAKMPSDDVLELAKQYIDGNIEIDELQKRVLEKYVTIIKDWKNRLKNGWFFMTKSI